MRVSDFGPKSDLKVCKVCKVALGREKYFKKKGDYYCLQCYRARQAKTKLVFGVKRTVLLLLIGFIICAGLVVFFVILDEWKVVSNVSGPAEEQ